MEQERGTNTLLQNLGSNPIQIEFRSPAACTNNSMNNDGPAGGPAYDQLEDFER